jgi:serine protease Do
MKTNPTSPRNRRVLGARLALALASLSIVGAACGTDTKVARPNDTVETSTPETNRPETSDHPHTTDTDPTENTQAPVVTVPANTTPDAGGAIAGIDTAQGGSIQIIAQGSLRDPEVGTYTRGGSGSGFFIDESGLAVTNNHVVTGAATLEVYVGGDLSKSYNAQVIGVSECNDLALIQVNTSNPVPFFNWFDGQVQAGLDVYAAGYPLGDPQFTLTKGIVAKAKAGGDLTGTSSIDHTIEHDAAIQPGNSGGPLLTNDGEIAGVNYAGGARDIGAQYYAISSDLAKGVVDKLADGDFESLGVNGYAISDDATGITGIWVGGVAAGSPASQVGLTPGDIITSMNGLPVGTDGTFKDYCDVIRTAGSKPISIEVLRFDTQEVLKGEINGDQPLALSFSFAESVEDEAEMTDASEYTTYVPVTDDTGTLTLEIPAEWAQVDTTPITDANGNVVPKVEASTDLEAFTTTYNAPGVQFAALPSSDWTVDSVLAQFAQSEGCTDGGISDYDDGVFVGKYQLWENCGGSDTIFVVLASNSVAGGASTYLTSVQAVTSADLDALDHILGTFNATA